MLRSAEVRAYTQVYKSDFKGCLYSSSTLRLRVGLRKAKAKVEMGRPIWSYIELASNDYYLHLSDEETGTRLGSLPTSHSK